MHRDLKPSNIFFSRDGSVKVGDFGLVTTVSDSIRSPHSSETDLSNDTLTPHHTNNVRTSLYMSPEQLSGKAYCNRVDIFSLGVIFFELLIPFETEMERQEILLKARNRVFPKTFTKTFPEECLLSKQLLAEDANERPTASDILSHPVVKRVKTDQLECRVRRRTISNESGDSALNNGFD